MSPASIARHEAPGAQVQADALAKAVGQQLRRALAEQGRALLAVSGGRSPVAFFHALSQELLDWTRVTVLLADERCVPPKHPDSNAALVRQHLLQGAAGQARFVPLVTQLPKDFTPASDAALQHLADDANERLQSLAWPLDVLVLGMGEDGHTASLFPDSPGLDEALHGSAAVAWVRPQAAPHARLTLGLRVLQTARNIHLPIAGEAKLAVLEQALDEPTPALPVSLVLHGAGAPVQVWTAP